MAKQYITVRGVGIDLGDAREDLYQRLREVADEQGFVFSQDQLAVDYDVSVRSKSGGAYIAGKRNANAEESFTSAVETARFTSYDPNNHRTRITARFDLKRREPTRIGDPSSAAPSTKGSKDITELF